MSLVQKISKASREIPIEVGRFLHRKYPDFVIDRHPQALQQEVPVFMFHTIEYETFKNQLEYLKINGYQTLNISNFMAFLNGGKTLNNPSVLLAFDDGEKSWYDVAFPLLKEYGFNAVGFVVPHYIQEEPVVRTASKGWLSWPELWEMDRSGVIEIESHSYYHDRIFTSPQLVDFYHPDYADTLGLDVPWLEANGQYTNTLQLGTPIYQYTPRLVGKPRYCDNLKVREACVDWVASQGGTRFFEDPNWRKLLTQYFSSVRNQFESRPSEIYESQEQTRKYLLEDLVLSKEMLSQRLGKDIQHLCYPWGIGSEQAVSLSQEAGYASNFWVTLDQRNSNFPGESPYFIPRLKDDYLFRLPGEGRHSLRQIFQTKLQRRKNTLEIY